MAELEYYHFTPVPPFEFKPRIFKLVQLNEDGTETILVTNESTETISQRPNLGQQQDNIRDSETV